MKQVTDRRKKGKKTTRNDGKKQTLKAKNQNLKPIPCNNDDANQKEAASF